VPPGKLPFAVPIALARSTTDLPRPSAEPIERPMRMGAMVITHKPTLWERVKGPFTR
jgi:hypothetical protein